MTSNGFTVIGLDPERPPKIQVTPCIDLFFQLSEQAPAAWCYLFQSITGRRRYPIKIDPEAGLFIETWVRKSTEVPTALETVRDIVEQTNVAYQKILDAALEKSAAKEKVAVVSEAQLELNRIVASLEFDPAPATTQVK